jgi:hypothetical protein
MSGKKPTYNDFIQYDAKRSNFGLFNDNDDDSDELDLFMTIGMSSLDRMMSDISLKANSSFEGEVYGVTNTRFQQRNNFMSYTNETSSRGNPKLGRAFDGNEPMGTL